jgi:GntR family transcriptional regulator
LGKLWVGKPSLAGLYLDHVAEDYPDFDPTGSDLLYVLVADHIETRIRDGRLRPGARLRAERDLADDYGVSYDTIRRAAVELRERKLIKTIHGKGTYVLPPE